MREEERPVHSSVSSNALRGSVWYREERGNTFEKWQRNFTDREIWLEVKLREAVYSVCVLVRLFLTVTMKYKSNLKLKKLLPAPSAKKAKRLACEMAGRKQNINTKARKHAKREEIPKKTRWRRMTRRKHCGAVWSGHQHLWRRRYRNIKGGWKHYLLAAGGYLR